MIPSFRKKLPLGSMRKREMTNVVAKSSHPQHATPVAQIIGVGERLQQLSYLIRHVVSIRDDIKNPTCELHNPKRMLKALVGRARIDEMSERELVDMAQPLEGT